MTSSARTLTRETAPKSTLFLVPKALRLLAIPSPLPSRTGPPLPRSAPSCLLLLHFCWKRLHQARPHRPSLSLPSFLPFCHRAPDTKELLFQGDAIAGHPPTAVLLPPDAFDRTPGIIFPTVATIDNQLMADHPLLGPFEDRDDPAVDVLTARALMFIPNKFITLALSRPAWTPFEAWTVIGAAIRQDAATDSPTDLAGHQPILQWLRVAVTLSNCAEGEEDPAPPCASLFFTEPPSAPHPMTAPLRTPSVALLPHAFQALLPQHPMSLRPWPLSPPLTASPPKSPKPRNKPQLGLRPPRRKHPQIALAKEP